MPNRLTKGKGLFGDVSGHVVPVSVPLAATPTALWVYVASRVCEVVAIEEIHSVVGGASAAVRPRKITDASAPNASAGATVVELTSAAFDLTATVNTKQAGSLVAGTTRLNAGDKIALAGSGTLTGLAGQLTVHIRIF